MIPLVVSLSNHERRKTEVVNRAIMSMDNHKPWFNDVKP